MITNRDFHIHTCYCDGSNTPEEMIKAALNRGFSSIGFTGHSFTSFDQSYCMSRENTQKYFKEITALKEKYKDKIEVFCGIEQDFYAEEKEYDFDYTIGSVHYIKVGDNYFGIDDSPEDTKNLLKNHFGGDFCAMAATYYSSVKRVVEKTNADIIGHLDLIAKYKHSIGLEETDEYLKLATDAVKELVKCDKPFEINVGTVNRGYRNSPYPSLTLLKEINRLGGKIIISGDCHNAQNLGDNFDLAISHAKAAGFTTALTLTKNGFTEYSL